MNHQPDERLDAYLWDPAAPPDDSVREIERRLAVTGFDPGARPLPRDTARTVSVSAPVRRARSWLVPLTVAAALVIGCFSWSAYRWTWPDGRAWPVRTPGGSPEQLAVGATLRTPPSEAALVQIARIGTMRVAGDTTVTLRSSTSNRHRLVLEEGSVHVRVWAPPFSVGFRTPSGEVSDLGCEFELTVTDASSHVRVLSGWVHLENIVGESLVPAGASSIMTAGVRPGVPVFDDAPAGLADAVRAHEAVPFDPQPIDRIVALARPRDVYTLLQLVQRRSPAAERLIGRSAQLFPPPDGVDADHVRAGDVRALDRWVSSFPLPSPKRRWLWNWRDGFSLAGDASR